MRKVYFLVVVFFSVSLSMFSEKIQTLDFTDFYSTDGKSTTMISQIEYSSAGVPFVLADFGSLTSTSKTLFGDKELYGADYQNGGSSSNKNLLFASLNGNLSLKWKIRSIDGVFQSGKFTPLTTGGAVVCAKFKKKEALKDSTNVPVFTLVDDFKDTLTVLSDVKKNISQTVIFKITKEGKIDTSNYLVLVGDTMYGEKSISDPFVISGIVEVTGGLVVCGSQLLNIVVKNKASLNTLKIVDTLKIEKEHDLSIENPSYNANGGAFIFKCDLTDFKISQKSCHDDFVCENFSLMTYNNKSVYVFGKKLDTVGGKKQTYLSFLKFNESTITVPVYKEFSNDLEEGEAYNFYDFVTYQSDDYLYITGGLKGKLETENGTISKKEKSRHGCLFQVDKNTGKIANAAFVPENVYSINQGFAKYGNCLYTFNYTTADSISLLQYDANLTLKQRITFALNGQNISACKAYGGKMLVAMRPHTDTVVLRDVKDIYLSKTQQFYTLLCNFNLSLAFADMFTSQSSMTDLYIPENYTTDVWKVAYNDNGESFALSTFQSKFDTVPAILGKDTLYGVDDRNNNNNNLLLTKFNNDLTIKWKVQSLKGNAVSSKSIFVPTQDGGAIVSAQFQKTRKSKADANVPQFVIVDDFGDTLTFLATEEDDMSRTVIFKISEAGKIDTTHFVILTGDKTYGIATNKLASFNVEGITEGANGNIYICGTQLSYVEYLKGKVVDTLKTNRAAFLASPTYSNNGSGFLIKCDTQFNIIGKVCHSDFVCETFKFMTSGDSSIYICGTKVDTVDNKNVTSLSFLKFDTAALTSSKQFIEQTGNVMIYDFVSNEEDTNIYVVGCMKGTLASGMDTFSNAEITPAQQGFLMIVNKNSGKIKKVAYAPSDEGSGYSVNAGFAKFQNKYYTFNYVMGTGNHPLLPIKMLQYDSALNLLSAPMIATNVTNVRSMSVHDDNLLLSLRTNQPTVNLYSDASVYDAKTKAQYCLITSMKLEDYIHQAPKMPEKPEEPETALFENTVNGKQNMAPQKFLNPDGTLVIIRNGKAYNVQGTIVK